MSFIMGEAEGIRGAQRKGAYSRHRESVRTSKGGGMEAAPKISQEI